MTGKDGLLITRRAVSSALMASAILVAACKPRPNPMPVPPDEPSEKEGVYRYDFSMELDGSPD